MTRYRYLQNKTSILSSLTIKDNLAFSPTRSFRTDVLPVSGLKLFVFLNVSKIVYFRGIVPGPKLFHSVEAFNLAV